MFQRVASAFSGSHSNCIDNSLFKSARCDQKSICFRQPNSINFPVHGTAKFVLQAHFQGRAINDYIGLINRENRVTDFVRRIRNVPMRIDRNEYWRYQHQSLATINRSSKFNGFSPHSSNQKLLFSISKQIPSYGQSKRARISSGFPFRQSTNLSPIGKPNCNNCLRSGGKYKFIITFDRTNFRIGKPWVKPNSQSRKVICVEEGLHLLF